MYTFGPRVPLLGYLVNMTLSPINTARDRACSNSARQQENTLVCEPMSTVRILITKGGALKAGDLRSRYTMGDVPTTDLSWIVHVYHS
jgi:hypothetical protein